MKQHWTIIRTITAMAVIFSSGVWVGRAFTPPKIVEIELPPKRIMKGPDDRPRNLSQTERRIIGTYRKELGLDPDQFEKFMELFVEQRKAVAHLPPGHSPERTKEIQKLHEQLRPILRPDQEKAMDRMMKEIESRTRR